MAAKGEVQAVAEADLVDSWPSPEQRYVITVRAKAAAAMGDPDASPSARNNGVSSQNL
jgi:hypothetical protein